MDLLLDNSFYYYFESCFEAVIAPPSFAILRIPLQFIFKKATPKFATALAPPHVYNLNDINF